MLFAEEIVDGLHRIEGSEGNFYEDCAPVAHGSIPETWQLEGFQLLAGFRLRGDEACGLVDEIRQIERTSLIVLHSADKIYGVEVCTLGEHLHVGLVVGVDLAALKDLQGYGAILIISEERASSRLAYVLYNAADTHRAVELATQIGGIGLLALGIGAEALADKLGNLFELCLSSACIKDAQILESLLLQRYEHSGDDLLPLHGFGLQTVGYDVVDVLDEDNVGIDLVKVLDEGSVTARTEQQ